MGATAIALVTLAGCNTEPQAVPTAGGASPNVSLTLHWPQASPGAQQASARVIPLSTETIELTVTAADISPDITATVTKADVIAEEAKVSLYVPPGAARLFRALARNGDGIILVGGSNTLDVTAGVVTTAGVELGPPKNGKIAFTSDRDGNREVYVMDADGGNPTNLTNNPADDATPCWSPDGMQIAFATDRDGNYEIYIMDADGGNQGRLTNDGSYDVGPAWSPDGSKVAFTRYSGPVNEIRDIYVMNADGSNVTGVTSDGRSEVAAWSPDGARIAFTYSTVTGYYVVYAMDADGSNRVSLAESPVYNNGSPQWSPDGSRIAFGTNRDGDGEIYVMDSDGGNQTNLTNWPGAHDRLPVWSPDGSLIAFDSLRDGQDEVYTMQQDGSNQTRLTNSPDSDWEPAWQPGF